MVARLTHNSPPSIPALVINLERSHQRWAFQQTQLQQLGIAARRLPAISTEDIGPEQYEQLANGWERKLRPAEVACFLSHRQAWQTVADSGHAMLILEDDALLSQHTPALLNSLAQLSQPVDYITLETRSRKKLLGRTPLPCAGDFGLRRLYQDRTGAAAYVLYPSGAAKLLAKAQQQAPALADAFICSSYMLNAWQVVPAAAVQLDQCAAYGLPFANPFVSTITPADQSKPAAASPAAARRFKRRRIAAQCRMGWRQLSLLGRAQRLHVGIETHDFRLPEIGNGKTDHP